MSSSSKDILGRQEESETSRRSTIGISTRCQKIRSKFQKRMHFFIFLSIFWHLVDIPIVDLLHVSLSSSIPKFHSLEEDRYHKYLFGSSCTMGNIIQYYISPIYFSWSVSWINSEVYGTIVFHEILDILINLGH